MKELSRKRKIKFGIFEAPCSLLRLTGAECWCRSNIDNLSPLKLSPVTGLYTNIQVEFQVMLYLCIQIKISLNSF